MANGYRVWSLAFAKSLPVQWHNPYRLRFVGTVLLLPRVQAVSGRKSLIEDVLAHEFGNEAINGLRGWLQHLAFGGDELDGLDLLHARGGAF